jgi:hypothetical protein
MTLMIKRISGTRRTCIRLSGHFRSEHIHQLKAELEQGGRIALDLAEVDLVDVECIRFLNTCEMQGIRVLHCSPYVKEWMLLEQSAGKKDQSG